MNILHESTTTATATEMGSKMRNMLPAALAAATAVVLALEEVITTKIFSKEESPLVLSRILLLCVVPVALAVFLTVSPPASFLARKGLYGVGLGILVLLLQFLCSLSPSE